jgi:hypothetical protein
MSILTTISDAITGKAPLTASRSPKWPAARTKFLKTHKTCSACGGTTKLEVHHIQPFHTNPELELDQHNMITLCESGNNGLICHLNVGHSGNYKCINPASVTDAIDMILRIKARRIVLI